MSENFLAESPYEVIRACQNCAAFAPVGGKCLNCKVKRLQAWATSLLLLGVSGVVGLMLWFAIIQTRNPMQVTGLGLSLVLIGIALEINYRRRVWRERHQQFLNSNATAIAELEQGSVYRRHVVCERCGQQTGARCHCLNCFANRKRRSGFISITLAVVALLGSFFIMLETSFKYGSDFSALILLLIPASLFRTGLLDFKAAREARTQLAAQTVELSLESVVNNHEF